MNSFFSRRKVLFMHVFRLFDNLFLIHAYCECENLTKTNNLTCSPLIIGIMMMFMQLYNMQIHSARAKSHTGMISLYNALSKIQLTL